MIQKKAQIVALIAASVVLALYVGGIICFSNVFMPNSYVLGQSVAFQTPASVSDKLENDIKGYALQVEGQRFSATYTTSELDVSFDTERYVKDALSAKNVWAWPLEIFLPSYSSTEKGITFNSDALNTAVEAQVAALNESATQPQNASIAYDSSSNAFLVTPEEVGNALDVQKVEQVVGAAIETLQENLVLPDTTLIQPTLFSTSPELLAAKNTADSYLGARLSLVRDGVALAALDPATFGPWIGLDEAVQPSVNQAPLKNWLQSNISSKLNTVGHLRTVSRPDGKTYTVSGGTYGWAVDEASLAASCTDAIKAGKLANIEVVFSSKGASLPDANFVDFPGRYIDIDLTEQTARLFDASGAILWQSPCITGNPNKGHATPTGVYFIDSYFNKAHPASVLIGAMTPAGVPEYRSPVSYWMPFVGNSIGLHDATWQSSFGGDAYLWRGSHGCVNLPQEAAGALVPLINQGDVVIVHY